MFLSILVSILYVTVVGGRQTTPEIAPKFWPCGSLGGDFRIQWYDNTATMCLLWSSWPLTYYEANRYCQSRGTRLGVFNTTEKMKILQRQKNVIYIGLDDIKSEGVFIWHNGQRLKHPHKSGLFNIYEPSNSEGVEDCVVLQGRLLNDVPCTMSYLFVCELEL